MADCRCLIGCLNTTSPSARGLCGHCETHYDAGDQARDDAARQIAALREALISLLQHNGGEAPADHPALYRRALQVLLDATQAAAEHDARLRAEVEKPWVDALTEAWAIIDFIAPADDPVSGPFRREVRRVVKAREAAVALLPLLAAKEGEAESP